MSEVRTNVISVAQRLGLHRVISRSIFHAIHFHVILLLICAQ